MRRKKYKATMAILVKAAEKALVKMDGSITLMDQRKGIIDADIPGGILSYGHRVRITIKPTIDKMNTVSVVSKSTGIQIVDWGSNSNTEDEVLKKINSLLR